MQNIQWTVRTKTLFFLSVLLFLHGFLFFNVFAALTGTSILIFLVYHKLSFERDIGTMQMNRKILENILYVNHPCHIKANIWHTGNSVRLTIVEGIPSSAGITRGNKKQHTIINAKTPFTFEYQLTFHHRGRHSFPPAKANITDQMKLFSTTKIIPSETRVAVHSDPADIQKAKRAAFAEDDQLVLPSLIGSESSVEFQGIREFSPGDDFKDIDWKASSRLQTLVTKIYEKKEILETTIFLDVSQSMQRHIGKQAKLDHAITIILQLAHVLQNLHHNVGFIAYNEHRVLVDVSPTVDYQQIFSACTPLPSSKEVSSYQPSLPTESDHILREEPIEHQRFLSTISPFLSGKRKPVKNRLHTTGIYQAVSLFLSTAKQAHLVFITDLETQTDALYSSLTLAHAGHHKQWLLTLFSPFYDEQLKHQLTIDHVESIYKLQHARERLLHNLRKKQVEIVNVTPTTQGTEVMQNVRRKQ